MSSDKDPKEYKPKTYTDRFNRPYSDATDRIGNQVNGSGHVLHWNHLATGANVHFKAFLTQFSDQYASNWNEQDVFGRMDSIETFKSTKRVINLAWDVPSATLEEAKFNLKEAEKFISMLYPVYEEIELRSLTNAQQDEVDSMIEALREDNLSDEFVQEYEGIYRNLLLEDNKSRKVATMVASPLFKLKFSNLIMDGSSVTINAGASESGLVGKLSGLSYEPDLEQGFFGSGEDSFDGLPDGALVPQTIKFSCQFTVIHTSPLGWRNKKHSEKRTPNFPYHGSIINKKRR